MCDAGSNAAELKSSASPQRWALAAILALGLPLAFLAAQTQGPSPAPTSTQPPPPLSKAPHTPNTVTRGLVMGDFKFHRGEYDEAIAAYRQSLQLAPSNSEIVRRITKTIRYCKAEIRVIGGDYLCGAAPPAPKSATEARTVGDSQFKRGEYDAAIDSYKEGLKLAPSSTELHSKLNAAIRACERDRATVPVPFTCGARAPFIKLIPPASYHRVVHPGVTEESIPQDDIERVLQPVGKLTVPTSSNAPPGAFVAFPMRVNIGGDVSPGETESDENGLGRAVLSAAQAWRFRPPTIRGEQHAIDLHVIVIF